VEKASGTLAEERAQREAEEQARRHAEEHNRARRQKEAEDHARRLGEEQARRIEEEAARRLRKEQRRRETHQMLRSLRQRTARLLSRRWVVILAVSAGIGAVLLFIYVYVSRPPSIMGELPADLRRSCSASTDTSATCRTDGTVVFYRLFETATEARADVVNARELAPDGTPCPPSSAPPAETPVVCSYEAGAETGVAAFSQTVKPPERFYGVRWNPAAHPKLSGAITTKNSTAQDWENLRSNWTQLAAMN
jgi:hypothetical protein